MVSGFPSVGIQARAKGGAQEMPNAPGARLRGARGEVIPARETQLDSRSGLRPSLDAPEFDDDRCGPCTRVNGNPQDRNFPNQSRIDPQRTQIAAD
jgi:hypothetical protein